MVDMVKKNLENFTQLFDEAFYCSEEELQRQIDEEMKEEGFKEGYDDGFGKGFNNGFNNGFNDGFSDGTKKEKVQIAKNMKILGANTIEQIATITGLSIEEIEKI